MKYFLLSFALLFIIFFFQIYEKYSTTIIEIYPNDFNAHKKSIPWRKIPPEWTITPVHANSNSSPTESNGNISMSKRNLRARVHRGFRPTVRNGNPGRAASGDRKPVQRKSRLARKSTRRLLSGGTLSAGSCHNSVLLWPSKRWRASQSTPVDKACTGKAHSTSASGRVPRKTHPAVPHPLPSTPAKWKFNEIFQWTIF